MKLKYLIASLLFATLLVSCNGDIEELNSEDLLPELVDEDGDSLDDENTGGDDGDDEDTDTPTSEASITATVDGTTTTFTAQTPRAFNESLVEGLTDSINLIASTGNSSSDGSLLFTFNRDNLAVGENSFNFSSTDVIIQFSFLNTEDTIVESVESGTVNITSVDENNGIVSGTFNFTVNQFEVDDLSTTSINTIEITNGMFTFSYDVNP